jgi:hypothetical protein
MLIVICYQRRNPVAVLRPTQIVLDKHDSHKSFNIFD